MFDKNLKFIAVGDWGLISPMSTLNCHQIKTIENINFNLLLGDNFYPNGVSSVYDNQWKEKFVTMFPSRIPSFPILGNHDYIQNPESQIQYSKINPIWQMPFYYYDFKINLNKQSVHFIMIDTCLLAEDITVFLLKNTFVQDAELNNYYQLLKKYQMKQKLWIQKKLENSTSKWKFVCGHYPILSNGPHIISLELQNYLMPLLEKYKVDFYISGHDHNLQHIVQNNINYVISGGFSTFYSKKDVDRGNNIKFVSDTGGYALFEMNDNIISMDFRSPTNSSIYHYLFSKL